MTEILTLLPEAQRLQALDELDRSGITALHYIVQARPYDSLRTILMLLPASQRSQAVNTQSRNGNTVLNLTNGAARESILALSSDPNSSSHQQQTEETTGPVDTRQTGTLDIGHPEATCSLL